MMAQNAPISIITATDLNEALKQDHPPIILDVREEWEVKICALPTFLHIPLNDLTHYLDHIPKDRLVVTLCHHGIRSLKAAIFLKSNGFDQVLNLAGGIDAWANQVGQTMTRY